MKKLISLLLSAIILCSIAVPVSAVEGDGSEPAQTVEPATETTAPTETTTSEPITETTEPTTEQPTTEPTAAPATKLTLKSSSATLYVGGTAQISATVQNGKGATSYKSSSTKIATVSKSGKVKAVKKGTATITVTNNGASAKFTVTVKSPKLNKTKITLKPKKTSSYKKTFTLKVQGQISGSKVTYKSGNTKIATVNSKGKITAKTAGKTTITAKYRGTTYKCAVTVKKLTEFDKKVKYTVTFKQKKKSLTMNIGETGRYVGDDLYDFKVKDNIAEALSLSTHTYNPYDSSPEVVAFTKKVDKWYSLLSKEVGNVKFSITDSKIATVNSKGKITAKAAGNTTLKIKLGNKTLKVKVIITKIKELTYKNKLYKACYSYKEAYEAYKDAFCNNIIKGKLPYYGIACYFNHTAEALANYVHKCIDKEFDNGQNFQLFFPGIGDSEEYYPNNDTDSGNYIELYEFNTYKTELKMFKEMYTEAQKIFKELDIYSYKEDYEKIRVLRDEWFQLKVTYGGVTAPDYGEQAGAYSVIINHSGVCQDYSDATIYLYTLLNIPCDCITSVNHMWNTVKVQGKWYNVDNLGYLGLWGKLDVPNWEGYTKGKISISNGEKYEISDYGFKYPDEE